MNLNVAGRELTQVEYLGDGAYVGFSGFDFVVFCCNGVEASNPVCFDYGMIAGLANYAAKIREGS